jgi:hypothetical protein
LYGLKFSKEDHIAFIKMLYELVTIPMLEPYLVNKFASTLVELLGYDSYNFIDVTKQTFGWQIAKLTDQRNTLRAKVFEQK